MESCSAPDCTSTRPVLSNVEAETLAMKLVVEPACPLLGAGQNGSNAFEMGSVTVARSAAVGTLVLLGVGFT